MTAVGFETDRLVLEWFSPELASAVLAGEPRPDWAEGFPGDGDEKAARYIAIRDTNTLENAPFFAYVIREKSTGLICGGTGFHTRPRDRAVELGYGLALTVRGHGYATEACSAMVRMAFDSGQVDVVNAETDLDNAASKAVLRRVGFVPLNEVETLWRIERLLVG